MVIEAGGMERVRLVESLRVFFCLSGCFLTLVFNDARCADFVGLDACICENGSVANLRANLGRIDRGKSEGD